MSLVVVVKVESLKLVVNVRINIDVIKIEFWIIFLEPFPVAVPSITCVAFRFTHI